MTSVRTLLAAGTLVLGATGIGAIASAAPGPVVATPGSDLSNDIHAGETGEHAVVNDVDTAKEADVEDGAVANVEEQVNQTGDSQSGPTSTGADATGDKSDPAGDSQASSGVDGQGGESATPSTQGAANR